MRFCALLALSFAIVSAPIARADQIFGTPLGATDGGESVSATADFHFDGTNWILTLTNTLPGIHDVGEALTGFFFTVSSGTASLSSQTGDLVSVAKKTGAVTDLGVSPLGWAFGSATDDGYTGFELCVICASLTAPAAPTEAILGAVSADGKYDNADGSIDGNPGHTPFVGGSATFKLSGLSSGTIFDDLTFSFGTTPGYGVAASVPEPAGATWLVAALLGIVGMRKKR